MKVQEALIDDEYTKYCDAKIANGATVNQIMSRQDWHYCWNKSQSALAEIDKCEPLVTMKKKDNKLDYSIAIEKLDSLPNGTYKLYASAQPIEKCEPVYLARRIGTGLDYFTCDKQRFDELSVNKLFHTKTVYTSPISKEWVGLTDKRIEEIAKRNGAWQLYSSLKIFDFVANINDELKQLNAKKG